MSLPQGPPSSGSEERMIKVGALEVYPAGLCVRVAGVKMALPMREFRVLLELAENAGRVVPAQVLLDRIWGPGFVDTTGTLKVHVGRVRKRLRSALGVDYIRTVRGFGYALDPELARPADDPPPS
jgi:two-component system, OmpR family, response regulator RegX3